MIPLPRTARRSQCATGNPATRWLVIGAVGALVACTAEETGRLAQSSTEVDCAPVYAALESQRTIEQQLLADKAANELRLASPHLDVPTDQLVQFFAPIAGQGRPLDPQMSSDLDSSTRYMLCDALLREVVTQHYLSHHPEYRL